MSLQLKLPNWKSTYKEERTHLRESSTEDIKKTDNYYNKHFFNWKLLKKTLKCYEQLISLYHSAESTKVDVIASLAVSINHSMSSFIAYFFLFWPRPLARENWKRDDFTLKMNQMYSAPTTEQPLVILESGLKNSRSGKSRDYPWRHHFQNAPVSKMFSMHTKTKEKHCFQIPSRVFSKSSVFLMDWCRR